jgi:hypothetical protein
MNFYTIVHDLNVLGIINCQPAISLPMGLQASRAP